MTDDVGETVETVEDVVEMISDEEAAVGRLLAVVILEASCDVVLTLELTGVMGSTLEDEDNNDEVRLSELSDESVDDADSGAADDVDLCVEVGSLELELELWMSDDELAPARIADDEVLGSSDELVVSAEDCASDDELWVVKVSGI